MMNCKRHEAQQVPASEEKNPKKPSCNLPPPLGLRGGTSEQAGNGTVIHTIPDAQGEVPKAEERILGTPTPNGPPAKTGGPGTPEDMSMLKENIAVKEQSNQGLTRETYQGGERATSRCCQLSQLG